MASEFPSYTVVGVVDGQYNIRLHSVVQAPTAEAAYLKVVADIPGRFAEASPGASGLLAAAVFEGRIRCAHRSTINGPWGEDRSGLVARRGELTGMTVVAVDPASKALKVRAGLWPAPGNAERDPEFDFFLLGSVLEGERMPVWTMEKALTPAKTLRNERIMAMLRYSPHFGQFFGTLAPIHMPA
jgi:hypothetical protein